MIILLLESLLLAVFLVLDILLFYIFFESILPPVIWSGKPYKKSTRSFYPSPLLLRERGGDHRSRNYSRSYSTLQPNPGLEPNFITGFTLFFFLLLKLTTKHCKRKKKNQPRVILLLF